MNTTHRLELEGKKYGRWTVSHFSHKNKYGALLWHCICECGNKGIIQGGTLINGNSSSCGCYQKETAGTHHMTGLPTFKSWDSMKQRCTNPNAPDYKYYGGRGITIHESWLHSFDKFLSDMGVRPTGKTLDRIDNNGNYEPSNCRWATRSEQQRNKKGTKKIFFQGSLRSIPEVSEITGMKAKLIRDRLRVGWSPDRILSTPSQKQ